MASITATDKKLLDAVYSKRPAANISALLAVGGNVAAVDSLGRTALYVAAANDSPMATVSELLAAGSDVNAADKDNMTALFCCCPV